MRDVTILDTLLWVVFPYVCMAFFVLGHIWRYRYDQFGWTTRSSQMYEDRILRWASPMFHFGILFVAIGHFGGLVIPKSWTQAIGISDHVYHLLAITLGTVAGVCTLVGLLLLIWRRRSNKRLMGATTLMDKFMFLMLAVVAGLGVWATIANNVFGSYDYRSTISVWFRQIWTLRPDAALMVDVPLTFQLHALVAITLFAVWPFTRLVHVFSVPVGYLGRPYIVYRSRDDKRVASKAGW